jgi:hypothetical protein
MTKRRRGFDRFELAERLGVSLSYLDRILPTVRPVRASQRGKVRGLWSLDDVRKALATGPSQVTAPAARLLHAQRRVLTAEFQRLEATLVSTAEAAATWTEHIGRVAATLKAWPPLALALDHDPGHRDLAMVVRDELVRPLLEQLAAIEQAPRPPSPPRRDDVRPEVRPPAAPPLLSIHELRASVLNARAKLLELRDGVRMGAYRRKADVESDWAGRVARARHALWEALPARLAATHGTVDAATLQRLLEEAAAAALDALAGGGHDDDDAPPGADPLPHRTTGTESALQRPRHHRASARRADEAGPRGAREELARGGGQ